MIPCRRKEAESEVAVHNRLGLQDLPCIESCLSLCRIPVKVLFVVFCLEQRKHQSSYLDSRCQKWRLYLQPFLQCCFLPPNLHSHHSPSEDEEWWHLIVSKSHPPRNMSEHLQDNAFWCIQMPCRSVPTRKEDISYWLGVRWRSNPEVPAGLHDQGCLPSCRRLTNSSFLDIQPESQPVSVPLQAELSYMQFPLHNQ